MKMRENHMKSKFIIESKAGVVNLNLKLKQ